MSDNNGALSNDFQGFCLSNISTDATYNKGAAAAAALVGVCCWTDIPAESNNSKPVFLTFPSRNNQSKSNDGIERNNETKK